MSVERLKTCPCCGADHIVWDYSPVSDTIQAMYYCDCYDTDPTFSARYSHEHLVMRQQRRFEESLPKRYADYTTRDLPVTRDNMEVVKAISTYQPDDILFIWGDTGRGKTHAAVLAAMETILKGKSARFIPEGDLIDEYRVKAITTADAELPSTLIIDDIAKEKATEFYAVTLYRVIEACTSWKRGLIITSNDPLEVVVERLSASTKAAAVESRLRMGKIIHVGGKTDWRVAHG